ncbi:MAG: ORF6C domain-containing protein [Chloroflexi bacterium]|nr:ORF6C domain-containing protein [Chloroflexota bacterium]
MTNAALVPIEQKEVVFYEDMITAVQVRVEQGIQVYVSIRQMCDLLGVTYQGQIRRISDDPVLSKQVKGVNITFTPLQGQGGGPQITNCLPIDYLNGWLFGINANRVKPEIRERLIIYQEKCYKVLTEAFREGRLTTAPELDDLLQSDTPAAQAYKIAQAIMQMARQQLMLEAQLSTHTTQLANHEQRLEELESTLGDPGRNITPDQAMQISQAVKAIAFEIEKRTKKNEYPAIYGQLYREFGITSYKLLPANKFERAIGWLTEWYRRITGATGDDLPF